MGNAIISTGGVYCFNLLFKHPLTTFILFCSSPVALFFFKRTIPLSFPKLARSSCLLSAGFQKLRGIALFRIVLFLFLLANHTIFTAPILDEPSPCQLFEELLTVDFINRKERERLPVLYNNLLQGGYFAMPSTRMGEEGEVGLGYAQVPPYRNWNVRFQYTSFLELSGNYRVFRGVEDHALTRYGFGDFSDKGVNLKIALWQPEETLYRLPGFAIGAEDILGTRAFKCYYCVFTQIFPSYNLEASLGWGCKRIRGFFGGMAWFPFRKWEQFPLLQTFCPVIEYDATPYKSRHIEKHPKGRIKKTPLNFGVKWRLWDSWDLSCSYIRGDALAFSLSTFFNFGKTKGLLPKKDNPLPYMAPINREPLSSQRTECMMAEDLLFALNQQRFTVLKISLSEDCISGKKTVKIHLINDTYRLLSDLQQRLDALIASLTPSDIEYVDIVLECEAFPIQEYHYDMKFVRRYAEKKMGSYELGVLTPARDLPLLAKDSDPPLFSQNRRFFDYAFYPKTETLFGSSRGKFKYALGLTTAFEGFLPKDVFWKISIGWLPFSKLYSLNDVDRINPSQLINVRTDIIRYYQNKHPTLDEGYLQKNWSIGRGFFGKVALGYFEIEYGGVCSQLLYYPVSSRYAFGLEGAVVKKRDYTGLGFTNKIRKLVEHKPTYRHFLGSQYFADLYVNIPELKVDLKIQAGKFLANDWGARFQLSRFFSSGLEISFWYTVTNGHDRVNGEIYFDKGVSLSMPIDMFYMRSSRERWGYSLSAWLRDVGAAAATGRDLYEAIQSQRSVQ